MQKDVHYSTIYKRKTLETEQGDFCPIKEDESGNLHLVEYYTALKMMFEGSHSCLSNVLLGIYSKEIISKHRKLMFKLLVNKRIVKYVGSYWFLKTQL